MRSLLLLTWRYVTYYRVRTAVLVGCFSLIFFLPIAVQLLVAHYSAEMAARSEATPLVIGPRGSRYDLMLNTLYFKGVLREPLTMEEVHKVRQSGLGAPIPLLIKHSAHRFPIVGTTVDYFGFRGLSVSEGSLPLTVGDAVLGANVAEQLGLGAGDTIVSDYEKLYDISASYPLKMRVVGVLNEQHTPDDSAVFVDIKTDWVIEGIGHGHQDAAEQDVDAVIAQSQQRVTLNESVVKFEQITPANIQSFHLHGDPETLPVSSVIVLPKDGKSATILKGRYGVAKNAQIVVPTTALAEIMDLVVRVKRVFDANSALVVIAALLFLALIIVLLLKIRQREFETLFKIGCDRLTVLWLQVGEVALVLGFSLIVLAVLTVVLITYVIRYNVIL